ncbi:MAG: hypothetical protein AB7P21_25430 [Lautropia sp.]
MVDALDIAVPMASLPTPMSGRNWMMRRLIIDSIRSDPEWMNGNYTKQPRSAHFAQVYFAIGTNGGNQSLFRQAPDREKADALLDLRLAAPYKGDANDHLYQWDSSRDYDPSKGLERIKAHLLAINSADDERNPPELGILDKEIKRVPNGRVLLIPGSPQTAGHGTTARAVLWKKDLEALLLSVPKTVRCAGSPGRGCRRHAGMSIAMKGLLDRSAGAFGQNRACHMRRWSRPMNRRHHLKAVAVASIATLGLVRIAHAEVRPTPSQVEGPFYPVVPIPLRSDLTRRGDEVAKGRPMELSGHVTRAGAPLADARIEIWQCDANGQYRHPRDGGDAIDPGFEGFGAQVTDAMGRYRFMTLVPVPYGSRPPHVHLRVWLGERQLLTTQVYPHTGDRASGVLDRIASMFGGTEGLAVRLVEEGGKIQARFDIVLA